MIGLSFVLAVAVIFVVARHEDICRKHARELQRLSEKISRLAGELQTNRIRQQLEEVNGELETGSPYRTLPSGLTPNGGLLSSPGVRLPKGSVLVFCSKDEEAGNLYYVVDGDTACASCGTSDSAVISSYLKAAELDRSGPWTLPIPCLTKKGLGLVGAPMDELNTYISAFKEGKLLAAE